MMIIWLRRKIIGIMNAKDVKEGKPNNSYTRAFLAASTVICMFAVYLIICGITPFGDRTWMIFDMKRQYVDFYSYYRTYFTGNDILYSFALSLGSGAVGFFTYYLSSPWLLLTLFFDKAHIPEAVTLMTTVKLGLAAFNANLFLDHYRYDCSHEKEDYPDRSMTVVFAISYTFCAFIISNIINPMWLDVFYLMPFVMLMLERLLAAKGNLGYVLSFAFMLLCNYYISFMVCIFIVMWTVYRCMIKGKGIKALIRAGLCSLWAVAVDALLMLPTFLELSNSPKDIIKLGLKLTKGNLAVSEILSKTFFMAYDSYQTMTGTPLVYAGTLVTIMTLLFYLNKKIPLDEKLGMGVMMLIFIVSFCIDRINLWWHAGMEPSGYPYREAFFLVFLAVICSSRCAGNMEGLNIRRIMITLAFTGGMLGYTASQHYAYMSKTMITVNAVLILATSVLLMLCCLFNREGMSRYLVSVAMLLFGIQMVELTANAVFIYHKQTFYSKERTGVYREKVSRSESAVKYIKNLDDSWYRMENLDPREQNDAMMYDYNGITHYSSAGTLDVRHFLVKLGFNDDTLYTDYGRDNTCLADSILGIRYVIDGSENTHPGYEIMDFNGEDRVLKNPYDLSVAMVVKNADEDEYTNPFDYQESMIGNMAGEKLKVFDRGEEPVSIRYTEDGVYVEECSWTTACDGEVFFYAEGISDRIQNLAIYMDDGLLTSYGNDSCMKVLNLGYHEAGDEIVLKIKSDSEDADFGKARFVSEDINGLGAAYERLKASKAEVVELSSSKLRITLPETEGEGLLLTIPYEKSWKAYADGKEVGIDKAYGALMYIPLSQVNGTEIELRYVPTGMKAGAVISIIAVIMLVSDAVICSKKRSFDIQHRDPVKEEN